MFSFKKLNIFFLIMAVVPLPLLGCWLCDTPPSPTDAMRVHPIVFIGTVESRSSQSCSNPRRSEKRACEVIRFSVKEVFAGRVEREVVMNESGYSCDFPFEQGKTYLVYTNMSKGVLAPAQKCSRTSELSEANGDVQSLRSITSEPQAVQ